MPPGIPMNIIFLDDHIVAVSKPAGLLVHRSNLDRHETRFALQLVRDRIGRHVYPVHRLDRPTSGVLLFALSPETARRLKETFDAGVVEKNYLAVVRGHLPVDGMIDHPLPEEPDRLVGGLAGSDPVVRSAVTDFRRLAAAELPHGVGRYGTCRYSLAELRPRTGRRHQLRRHLKHLSHPIVGDTNYGEGRHNRLFREKFGCHRMLLHAVELSFPHPANGESLSVTAPLDEAFADVIERLGWGQAISPHWLL